MSPGPPQPPRPPWVQAGGRGAGGASGDVLGPGRPGRGGQTPPRRECRPQPCRPRGKKIIYHLSCHSNEQLRQPASNFRAHQEGDAFPIPAACTGFSSLSPAGDGGVKHLGAQKPACTHKYLTSHEGIPRRGGAMHELLGLPAQHCCLPAPGFDPQLEGVAHPNAPRASHGIPRMECCHWRPAGVAGALSCPQTPTCPEAGRRPWVCRSALPPRQSP